MHPPIGQPQKPMTQPGWMSRLHRLMATASTRDRQLTSQQAPSDQQSSADNVSPEESTAWPSEPEEQLSTQLLHGMHAQRREEEMGEEEVLEGPSITAGAGASAATELSLNPQSSSTGMLATLVGMLMLSLPLGVSAIAFQALTTPPTPNCATPKSFRADLAELQCLRQAMQTGEFQAIITGLDKLQTWSSDSPVYSVAERLLEEWSVVALSLAQEEFEAGNWDVAAQLTRAIPKHLALQAKAQERLSLWQQIQAQGEEIYALAQDALQQQDWQATLNHAEALAGLKNDYWKQQGIQALPDLVAEARKAVPATEGEQVSRVNSPAPVAHAVNSHRSRTDRKRGTTDIPQQRRRLPSPIAMPALVSLERLTVSDPGWVKPEFSAV